MSFDPCRLVRLTDQVEFSHFEVREDKWLRPQTEPGQNALIPTPVQSMENCLLEGATGKPQCVTSFMDVQCHREQTTGTFEIVPNKEEVPLSFLPMASPGDSVPWKRKSTQHNPVQLVPSASQICLTYNAAYHSCPGAISEHTTVPCALPSQRTRSSAGGKLLSFHLQLLVSSFWLSGH